MFDWARQHPYLVFNDEPSRSFSVFKSRGLKAMAAVQQLFFICWNYFSWFVSQGTLFFCWLLFNISLWDHSNLQDNLKNNWEVGSSEEVNQNDLCLPKVTAFFFCSVNCTENALVQLFLHQLKWSIILLDSKE